LDVVAKSGVFTIQGSMKTAIDCAKIAKAYDVLLWASKERDFNHAWKLYTEKEIDGLLSAILCRS
jgi:hypothetical protein